MTVAFTPGILRLLLAANLGLGPTLASAAPEASPGACAAPAMVDNFWTRNVRKVHFDLHTPATEPELGRHFDPVDFADKMVRSGTQAMVFFCRDAYGHSFHPSKFNAPHPGLQGDLFGDLARELHRRGLGVIGYFGIMSLAQADAARHPDWLAVRRDGKPNADTLCPSSRYWEDSLIPELVEVTRAYPVGALWMDGVYQWFSNPCVCERCLRLFGAPLPANDGTDPNWRKFDKFIQELVWSKLNACAEAAHAANPAIVIGSDWVGSPMWAHPEPERFDFNTGDIRFDNGPLNAAFAFAAWTWRGKPADVNLQRTYWWQEFNTRGIHDLHREFATTLASCGSIMLGDTLAPFDLRLDEEQVRFYREAFAGTAPLEPVVAGARPRADIAVLLSPEQLRAPGTKWPVWSPTPREADPHYGLYAAIVEAGLTAHLLCDADLDTHLSRYRSLVLPEVACVGSAAAAAIERYVRSGGNLVLVGRVPFVLDATAPWTETAAGNRRFFETLAGLHVEGLFDDPKTFFHPNALQAAGLWHPGVHRLPVNVAGPATKASLAGAESLAPLALPGRPINIGGHTMGEPLPNPAFSRHTYGQGRVFFAAQPLASDFWKRGARGVGCALQALLAHSAGELFARREGGSLVQLLVSEKPGQTALHLIAHLADVRTRPGRQNSEPLTVSGPRVIVRTSREVAAIRAVHSGAPVAFSRDGTALVVVAPPFETWESLVIDWK